MIKASVLKTDEKFAARQITSHAWHEGSADDHEPANEKLVDTNTMCAAF